MAESQAGRAYGYVLLAICGWATAASAFELALESLTVLQVLAVAAPSSALVLLLVMAIQGKIHQLWRQSPLQLGISALQGALNPCSYYLILLAAYDRLPAQVAMSLNYTWPLMLAMLAVPILGEPLRWRTVLAIGISLVGVILLATQGNFSTMAVQDPIGVGLALLSTVIWCSYWLVNVRDGRDGVVKLSLSFLFGSGYVGLLLILTATPLVIDWQQLGFSVYIGIAEMGLAFVFWLQGLELAPERGAVANLSYLSPFLSLGLIALILKEPIAPISVVGLALIIGSILWQSQKATARVTETGS